MADPTWQAGHALAAIPVDPVRPIYLAGYGTRRASEVRDPLEVHAIALRHGGAAVIVLSIDLLGLFHEQAEAVEAAAREALGPSAPPVVVTCTHTHAGPDPLGLWGPAPGTSGVDGGLHANVRRAATRAATKAWRRLQPATFASAQAPLEGIARNARDPDVLDPLLTLLAWDPVVRVVHFACHPEVLGPDDTRISKDLAGAVDVFWQGALGGMVTPVASGEDALRRLTARLARAAAELGGRLRPAAGGLALIRRDVALPQDNPAFAAAAEAGVLDRPLPGGAVRSCAGLLQTGPHLWHLAPGEVLPALARRWEAESRAARPDLIPGVIGLAGDEIGYILPEEAFDPARYEERTSLGPRTAGLLTAAYREMRAELPWS